MKTSFWHWPDHIIRLREARRLRDEHNAAMNQLVIMRETLDYIYRQATPVSAVVRARDALNEAAKYEL